MRTKGIVLSPRHKLALAAFDQRSVIYPYHLPAFVGPKTMDELVKWGLVEAVEPEVQRYKKAKAWQLKKLSTPDL